VAEVAAVAPPITMNSQWVLRKMRNLQVTRNVPPIPDLSTMPCPVKEVRLRAGIGTERGKGKKIVTGTGSEAKKEIRVETETGKETGKQIRRERGIATETRIESAITGTVIETVIVTVIDTTETGIEMIMTATGV
jgi:hypothetical protein